MRKEVDRTGETGARVISCVIIYEAASCRIHNAFSELKRG